jgi:4a-hydroxytetrahydrobiopterin dehydratase
MALLTDDEIVTRLGALPGWTREANAIRREYGFKGFADALAFAARVAVIAAERDHHPDILLQFSKVTLTSSSHDAGGLTARDFDLAKAVDA